MMTEISTPPESGDSRREGFEVLLIEAGTRPVTPEGGQQSLRGMGAAGVRVIADD
ncbi:hypothetical protein TVNIR_1187 [Thioalkalivibrio nitratireducens DSM 14787]|uniref:Uncharacterized protein n=1 Tax=Thioalkalivibrio nitratireducens (strain DSM 14787 / UNIQEM 213 / ALEN2) TaxID=1255043 RepID=L0DV43_THIND|nr:hypothetical protein [Thioalkalivibrio nitratireducens]AGA32862.1 hypothetical protein TVNIR_1187 [Thioalkalivibrio nitratireducens DSM 14787]